MKINIEEFIEKEGKKIAENIFNKYGEDPVIKHKSIMTGFWDCLSGGSVTNLRVREDIYERAQQEAASFFIKNGANKFDNKTIEIIKSYLRSRLKEPKKLKKLNTEEMLANAINAEVVSSLVDKGLVV